MTPTEGNLVSQGRSLSFSQGHAGGSCSHFAGEEAERGSEPPKVTQLRGHTNACPGSRNRGRATGPPRPGPGLLHRSKPSAKQARRTNPKIWGKTSQPQRAVAPLRRGPREGRALPSRGEIKGVICPQLTQSSRERGSRGGGRREEWEK